MSPVHIFDIYTLFITSGLLSAAGQRVLSVVCCSGCCGCCCVSIVVAATRLSASFIRAEVIAQFQEKDVVKEEKWIEWF